MISVIGGQRYWGSIVRDTHRERMRLLANWIADPRCFRGIFLPHRSPASSRSGFDEPAEQKRRCASANGSAECVETSDSQGTSLEREDLAGGQIGRTRRRGSKEETRKPGRCLCHRSEKAGCEEIGGDTACSLSRKPDLVPALLKRWQTSLMLKSRH
jgi:hypothetical protein